MASLAMAIGLAACEIGSKSEVVIDDPQGSSNVTQPANADASAQTSAASASGASDSGAARSPASAQQSAASSASSTGSTSSLTAASGARAARIIFKNSSPSGSFDAAPTTGTVNTPGAGHKATRVFNPDGSLLASGTSSSNWPKWLTSVEIGISGSSNTGATDPDCARFAANGEDTQTTCNFDLSDTTSGVPCGASPGLYRVSELDCNRGTISNGIGGPYDPVTIRATFSRDTAYLSAWENIMVVLEYSAAVVNGAPATPTTCFTRGRFDPANPACSDMAWAIFAKHAGSETTQPFLLLVPPALGALDTANNRGGGGVGTKSFILPMATDSSLSVLQISRLRSASGLTDSTTYYKACSGGTRPSNSALCFGMVFYAVTFYRI